MRNRICLLAVVLAVVWSATVAQAHFLWVVTEPAEQASRVRVYFGEVAGPDDPELLDRVAAAEVWALGGRRQEPEKLELKKVDDALEAEVPAGFQSSQVVLKHTYGVLSKGGAEPFLLMYYGKNTPSVLPGTWQALESAEKLPLEIAARQDGSQTVFRAFWQGKPLPGAAVTIEGPGIEDKHESVTDENGETRLALTQGGLFSIRAKHVEDRAGELDGREYKSVRHYSTLSLRHEPARVTPVANRLPALPQGVTSFGGAVLGDHLYVYGGHYGAAHHYSQEGQSGDFLRLNLRNPAEWERLPGGPKLTGLAMVPHGGRLYRVGGFTAKNTEAEEESLWSMSDAARFNPESGAWENLPALPEGRSSHDAAVLGNTLYVVGGWRMQAGETTRWHDTALTMDLSAPTLEWKTIPGPPANRRAIALAAHQGRVYAVGGMQEQGGPTTSVAVFDPATQKWSDAPSILGGAMDGFGSSSFASNGQLFVTTMSGSIQRLSASGDRWEYLGQMEHPRFFHRMLPWGERQMVSVGGASMSVGKIEALEMFTAPETKDLAQATASAE